MLEVTNREIRLQRRVRGVFLSIESYYRLVTWYLIEYVEDCANHYPNIRNSKLGQILGQEQISVAN